MCLTGYVLAYACKRKPVSLESNEISCFSCNENTVFVISNLILDAAPPLAKKHRYTPMLTAQQVLQTPRKGPPPRRHSVPGSPSSPSGGGGPPRPLPQVVPELARGRLCACCRPSLGFSSLAGCPLAKIAAAGRSTQSRRSRGLHPASTPTRPPPKKPKTPHHSAAAHLPPHASPAPRVTFPAERRGGHGRASRPVPRGLPAPLPTADMAAGAPPHTTSSAGPVAAALPRPARSRAAAAAAASGEALLPSTKMVLPAQAPRALGGSA